MTDPLLKLKIILDDKFEAYDSEHQRLDALQIQEMKDSKYGFHSGRGGMDVHRPIRYKYEIALLILNANYKLIEVNKAEAFIQQYKEKYQKLTGNPIDLTGIIERNYEHSE